MLLYVINRLLYTIPIAVGVSIICFALVHIGPGDPLSTLLPEDAPQDVVDRLKAEYGLDKPLVIQYVLWLGKALTGDFGISIVTSRSVLGEVLPALVNSCSATNRMRIQRQSR